MGQDDERSEPARSTHSIGGIPGPADALRDLGEFIKSQREMTKLSVRRLSEMAGVSNPYLSQIERGLRKPSADILQQLAKALRISAETLYVRAGILDDQFTPAAVSTVPEAIAADADLTDEHKQALLGVYESFRGQLSNTSQKSSGPTKAPAKASAKKAPTKAAKPAAKRAAS
jgi:transcriptional regulator with XRE-family HTH domain